jgi:hypothetical protein
MKGQYLNICYSILKNPNFTSNEKLILAEIVSLAKLKFGCTAGDEHYIEIINKSRQTVNGIMKKFEKEGLLIITKKGKGKTTKLAPNFEELLMIPFANQTNLVVVEAPVLVEISDNTCRESSDLDVEKEDATCRETDTINTSTITSLIIQESPQYTGGTENNPVDNFIAQHLSDGNRIIELMRINPELLTNEFIKKYQFCLLILEHKFGPSIINDFHILKSNNELYKMYGGFSNFSDVRDDLMFVKENMDRFLRCKTFE